MAKCFVGRRLEISDEGRFSQVSRKVTGGGGQLVGRPHEEVRDALSYPRAEALVLGALQDAVRILLDYCSKHLDVILKNKVFLVLYLGIMIRGVRQGVVANTGGQLLLASPGALTGARGVEVVRYGHKGGQDASGSRRRDQLRTPGMVQSASHHGVEPRILEPYGSPHQGQVNPFWRAAFSSRP